MSATLARTSHVLNPETLERITILGPTVQFLTDPAAEHAPCIMRGTSRGHPSAQRGVSRGLIAPEHLAFRDDRPAGKTATNIKIVERQLIEQVLRDCRGNKSKAARRLGLTRKQLYVRLRQYALD
jgi:DNA-binding NtrC family response regulator